MKDRALDALAVRLARHVGPGALTLAGLASSLAAAALAWQGLALVAAAAWLVGRLADGLDGPVARRRGSASDLGGYLDVVADTVGYAVVPLGVAAGLDDRAGWVTVAVLPAVLFVNAISWSYLAAILEKRGAGAASTGEVTAITMPPALVEGTETIVVFTAFLAVPRIAPVLFGAMAVLVAVNVAQRLRWARRHL